MFTRPLRVPRLRGLHGPGHTQLRHHAGDVDVMAGPGDLVAIRFDDHDGPDADGLPGWRLPHQRAAVGAAPDDFRGSPIALDGFRRNGSTGIWKGRSPRAGVDGTLLWTEPPTDADFLTVPIRRKVPLRFLESIVVEQILDVIGRWVGTALLETLSKPRPR